MQTVGILPSQKNLGGGTGFHRQHGTHGNGITQAGGAFHSGDAHALIALAAVNLRRLASTIEQGLQDRAGGGQQTILACCGGKFGETGAEYESAMLVAQYETVAFQCNSQTMCGRSSETGGGHKLSQRRRAGFQCVKNLYSFIKDANAGMDFPIVLGGGVFNRLGLGQAVVQWFFPGISHNKGDYAISHSEMANRGSVSQGGHEVERAFVDAEETCLERNRVMTRSCSSRVRVILRPSFDRISISGMLMAGPIAST